MTSCDAPAGTQAKETVYLVNSERTAYHFSFVESSLSSDSTARELVVEPMAGTVPANGRWASWVERYKDEEAA